MSKGCGPKCKGKGKCDMAKPQMEKLFQKNGYTYRRPVYINDADLASSVQTAIHDLTDLINLSAEHDLKVLFQIEKTPSDDHSWPRFAVVKVKQ